MTINNRKLPLCLCSLFLTFIILLDTAAGQSLTLFWYTDTGDLIAGKSADLLIKPGSATYGTTDSSINANEKSDATDAIDVIRGAVFPSASNMNKVKWDSSLEDAAKDAAKQCDGSTPAGQISVPSATRLSFKDALALVMAEGKNFDFANNKCKKSGDYTPCKQYRLLMSASITGMACSRAHCPDTALPYRVHCALSPVPTGAEATGPLYKAGTPCQLCPRDRGYCYNNLCVSHAEKLQILAKEPKAVVSCSAPCLNCGVRKDVTNVCSCHCPAGYTSAVDCSAAGAGASAPKCGVCERAGRPCLNGGIDSGEATCRCLCPRAFKGQHCEMPNHGYTGGVVVPIEGPKVCVGSACAVMPPSLSKLNEIVDELKTTLANDINTFCKKNQANYIKCCGVGTLPTSGSMDFVTAADIKVAKPVAFDADGKLNAPMYATVKGNNGLCRKTTDSPPPIVPVPTSVLTEIINDKVPNLKATCCQATVSTVSTSVKTVIGSGQSPEISTLIVSF